MIKRVTKLKLMKLLLTNGFEKITHEIRLLNKTIKKINIYKMKNIILSIASSVLFLQSCASQIYMEPQQLATVLQSGEFMFTAKRANPTNYAVINTVSSIPNATSTEFWIWEPATEFSSKIKK
jgi:hypothetical protein